MYVINDSQLALFALFRSRITMHRESGSSRLNEKRRLSFNLQILGEFCHRESAANKFQSDPNLTELVGSEKSVVASYALRRRRVF